MLSGRARLIAIAGAFFAPILVAGLLGYGTGKVESAAATPEPDLGTVTVVTPSPGVELLQGQPVSVHAVANGPEPFASIELWVNGQPIASIPGPDGGVAPLEVVHGWVPVEPGVSSLTVRAVEVGGGAINSDPIVVSVADLGLELEETAVVASGGGIGPPPSPTEIANLPPPPTPTQLTPAGPTTPVGEAVPFNPSIGNLIPWIFGSATPPDAPSLTASAAGCTVLLSLEDLSDDELGFRVYRTDLGETDPGSPQFVIGAHDGGWVEFQDTVQSGSVHTYVAESFNSFGPSGSSNPVFVSTIESGCAPPETEDLVVVIPVSLGGDDPVEDPYCYISPLGENWARLPSVGFFDNDDDGSILSAADLANAIGPIAFGEKEPATEPFPGKWDCWGWEGGILVQVGTFDTGETPVEFGAFPAQPTKGIGELALEYGVFEVQPGPALSDLSPIATVYDPVVREPSMLAPVTVFSSDTADCVARLDGAFSFEDGVAFCHPQGGQDDPDSKPHPYVLWDSSDPSNCDAGTDCVHPKDFSFFPHSVVDAGFRIYDLNQSETVPVKTLSGFDHDLYIAPLTGDCAVHRAYVVRSFVKTDAPMTYESKSFESVTSFNEPCSPDLPVKIDVTFLTLTLADVDDDDFGFGNTEDVEVYGGFYAVAAGGSGRWLELGNPVDRAYCTSSELIKTESSETALDDQCPLRMIDGTTNLENIALRDAAYGDESSVLHSRANNVARITTTHGRNAIQVFVDLWDNDSASDDDQVCRAGMWITKEPDESWENVIDGEEWHLYQGDNGNASCTVVFTTTIP